MSKMLEILGGFVEMRTGYSGKSTFRVSNLLNSSYGRNIAYERPKGYAKDGLEMAAANAKYATLSSRDLEYWQEIKEKYVFYTRKTAFISSFLMTVKIYGLTYAITHDITYKGNPNRIYKNVQFANSYGRSQRVESNDYLAEKYIKIVDEMRAELWNTETVPKIDTIEQTNKAIKIEIIERKNGFGKNGFGTNGFGKLSGDYTEYTGFGVWKYGVNGFGRVP